MHQNSLTLYIQTFGASVDCSLAHTSFPAAEGIKEPADKMSQLKYEDEV